MNLSKQQVKSLLDIMSSDDSRPALCQLWIETMNGKTYAVATDSYHAICLELPAEFEKLTDKVVTRAELTKFYKLQERGQVLIPDGLKKPSDRYRIKAANF